MGMNSLQLWWTLVTVLGISRLNDAANPWNFDLNDYKNHVCKRPCEVYTTPRLCHYDFAIENYYALSKACYDCPFNQSNCYLPQCVTAGGVSRVIKTVNRILPGPSIEVCEGDTIEVKVANMLDNSEGTTIHWHGILQQGTQHMDGTPMVTQCPILMGSHFTYRFPAVDVGTYFWHGHAGTQRSDGLVGALVIRQSPSRDPHSSLYDYDLSEHVIIVKDWLTVVSTNRLAELVHIRENLHMAILINGLGQFQEFSNDASNMTYFTPRASFTVQPGLRYRFRVINSGTLNCPLELSIDNHTMNVIASDGSPVQPLMRNSFAIHAGERFDFILTAKNASNQRNYWIRLRGLNSCTTYNVTQAAVLKYAGATGDLPLEPLTWEDKPTYTSSEYNITDVPIVEQLVSLAEVDDIVLAKPDRKIFLDVDMVKIQNLVAYNPPLYTVESSALFESPQINYITSFLPPAPPLTQLQDLPESTFCNAETVQMDCQQDWCACVHLYKIDLGALVELIILDDDAYHPMHLHGYKFRVVGNGKLEDGTPLEELKEMDFKGLLNRTTGRAPIKDTVAAPIGGYNILRFRANNPGFWLFHCHLEFHAETGMLLIFQVGNSTQLPPRPKNFPVCGSFDFTGYEDITPLGGQMNTCSNNYNSGDRANYTCNCNFSSRR
uniref:Uncharacterized protein n=1 Tax=Arion vulgaris TaxID=1028688 RepID=A0A0B7BKV4_9EUPU